MSHTIDTENNTSVDQTSAIAGNDVSDHMASKCQADLKPKRLRFWLLMRFGYLVNTP